METYWVPMWVVECGVQRDGCISMVKAADAQATVEALQARVRELEESRDAWRASQECSEKAYMALVNQIPAERFDYDPVNVALLDGAKEQEIIGRKQIADLQAALDAEREKVKALDAMYRQQLEGRDKRIDNLAGSAKIWMEKLTQIRALVRVYKEAVDYYAKTAISARAVDALEKAATLDATTPAVCPDCDGDGAVDSGGTDPNGNPLMRRCGCREKGGDGE